MSLPRVRPVRRAAAAFATLDADGSVSVVTSRSGEGSDSVFQGLLVDAGSSAEGSKSRSNPPSSGNFDPIFASIHAPRGA
jgi:hypothetical protein